MESGITPSNLLLARIRSFKFGRVWPKFSGNLPDKLLLVTDKKTKEEILKIEVRNSPEKLFSES